MTFIWLFLFVFFILIEASTVNLVSIWFAVGAVVSSVVALFLPDAYIIQILVFIGVSVVALLITKPIAKKIRTKEKIATNLDQVIGKIGLVTVPIQKHSLGEVKVLGKKWSAISKEEIAEGEEVKVLRIDGVKLEVERK